MRCKSGIWVEKQGMNVPCGQCMPCRINKGRHWSVRILLEEMENYRKFGTYTWFLTLTYHPDKVPYVPDLDGAPLFTLRKKKFLKWLNNEIERTTGPLRYYAVGEYGEQTLRPHYHLAVFPRADAQAEALSRRWSESFGHTSMYPLNAARARYLANYTAKKLTSDTDIRLALGQEPEFRTSSRSPALAAGSVGELIAPYLGKRGAAVLADRGDVERTIRIDGIVYPLPPFLLSKMRKELNIPLLHRDRIRANPNYLAYHEAQEAEFDEYESAIVEDQLNAKAKRKSLHGSRV